MIELNNLPEEVLCMILSQVNSWHICNLFRVCRLWKYLCSERVHFKFIDMGQYHRDMHKYMILYKNDTTFRIQLIFIVDQNTSLYHYSLLPPFFHGTLIFLPVLD